MQKISFIKLLLLVCCIILSGNLVQAQTTEFTYQGKLVDNSLPANANYDFEFRLFAADTGGSPIGTLQRLGTAVSNGVFSVKLDFGVQFSGATRYLEVAVKPAGGGAFTTLTPRQPVTSAPYSIRSLNAANADSATTATNATQLGGIAANQYVLTGDSRLSDARNPLPNSANYIQNNPPMQQTPSNFNISGNGTVGGTITGNIITANTQFNIGANRILANPGSENLFAGAGAGTSNTSGIENAFFGRFAGNTNTTGSGNTFFGFVAGRLTVGGNNNSFFGNRVGLNNSSGSFNSFFGHRAGENNNGTSNSFFGTGAGLVNFSGNSNTFLGHDAGNTNTTGSFNTIIGDNSDVSTSSLTNAAAIGTNALVSQSNSLILGSINGVNSATADTNVGIGTTAPSSRLHINGPGIVRLRINSDSNAGLGLALNEQSQWSVAVVTPGNFQIFNDRTGSNALTISTFDNSINISTLNVSGITTLTSLGNAGSTALCRNASNQISLCSSSIRYKSNINPFSSGLNLITRLRPVLFNWTEGGMLDFGLVAEDVAAVEPLLATYNEKGEVEGVKYDRLGVVLINAVKEQQEQISQQKQQNESLQKQVNEQNEIIKRQQAELAALKSFLCSNNPAADFCQPKN